MTAHFFIPFFMSYPVFLLCNCLVAIYLVCVYFFVLPHQLQVKYVHAIAIRQVNCFVWWNCMHAQLEFFCAAERYANSVDTWVITDWLILLITLICFWDFGLPVVKMKLNKDYVVWYALFMTSSISVSSSNVFLCLDVTVHVNNCRNTYYVFFLTGIRNVLLPYTFLFPYCMNMMWFSMTASRI